MKKLFLIPSFILLCSLLTAAAVEIRLPQIPFKGTMPSPDGVGFVDDLFAIEKNDVSYRLIEAVHTPYGLEWTDEFIDPQVKTSLVYSHGKELEIMSGSLIESLRVTTNILNASARAVYLTEEGVMVTLKSVWRAGDDGLFRLFFLERE